MSAGMLMILEPTIPVIFEEFLEKSLFSRDRWTREGTAHNVVIKEGRWGPTSHL
jgi:hypothetical protein